MILTPAGAAAYCILTDNCRIESWGDFIWLIVVLVVLFIIVVLAERSKK